MTDGDSSNAFESDKPGSSERTRAEIRIEDLRSRGGVFVEAVRATRMAMVITDPALPDNPIVFANQSFLALSGYSIDEVLGQRPYFLNGPETDPRDAARFQTALAEDHDETLQTIQYAKDGTRMVVLLFLTALKDDDGRTLYHLLSWRDITRQVEAEGEAGRLRVSQAALRESKDRYRTLFEAIDSGFCIIEMIFGEDGRATDYRFIEANPTFERQSGLVDAVGRRIREFAPDLEEHWFERYGRVALTGEPLRIEGEVAPLGRWFDINAFRVGAPELRRIAVLFQDITDRKHAETALRTSEEQFESLLNQAPLGVYLVDGDFVIRQVNPVALPVFGEIAGGPIGRDFDEVIHILWDEEYADEVVRIFQRTLNTGEPYVTAERAEHRSDRNTIEYYEWRVDRIPLSGGQYGVVCYFRDISAQVHARRAIEEGREFARESERRQGLLLAELQHRVRNILALVQSVARRTQESNESADDYARHLVGRIAAMARTQSLLTRSAARQVDLEEVLRDELMSVAAREEQYWCEGPDVALAPKAAEVLTLAIHELATNSVKYGALCRLGGQVEIRWNIEHRETDRWLVFEWEESRVPNTVLKRKGFGTELITRRVPYELRGKGSLTAVEDGIKARIEFPLVSSTSILETGMPEELR